MSDLALKAFVILTETAGFIVFSCSSLAVIGCFVIGVWMVLERTYFALFVPPQEK